MGGKKDSSRSVWIRSLVFQETHEILERANILNKLPVATVSKPRWMQQKKLQLEKSRKARKLRSTHPPCMRSIHPLISIASPRQSPPLGLKYGPLRVYRSGLDSCCLTSRYLGFSPPSLSPPLLDLSSAVTFACFSSFAWTNRPV